MKVRFGEKGIKDVPITEVTPENYIVPEGEENTYHVIQEIPSYHQRTGKRLSKPRVQKYGAKEFKAIERILKQQGYEITVLYDPTAFLMQQEREREERKTLTAAKKRELEQKRYEAEKAKMKSEILAELKEEGWVKESRSVRLTDDGISGLGNTEDTPKNGKQPANTIKNGKGGKGK